MPRLNVRRNITIARPRASLSKSLVDFHRWPLWSPWLCQEPEARVTYEGNTGEPGSGYSWDGNRVGAGRMQLASQTDERIDCDLTFLKPWRSETRVGFDLEALDDQNTRVTWSMQSSLPFFLFFMRRSFESFVGMDYDRGLKMLKELEETGKVSSDIALSDEATELPACHYVGTQATGTFAGLGPTMGESFPALEQQVSDAGLEQDGAAFCHYTRMDPAGDNWVYTMGIPVKGTTDSVLVQERARVERCAHVQHKGSYVHLGNAWSTVFGAMRARKLKHDKRSGGFEIYRQAPSSPEAGDAVTDIYLPLR